jgi:hypothetical protein
MRQRLLIFRILVVVVIFYLLGVVGLIWYVPGTATGMRQRLMIFCILIVAALA